MLPLNLYSVFCLSCAEQKMEQFFHLHSTGKFITLWVAQWENFAVSVFVNASLRHSKYGGKRKETRIERHDKKLFSCRFGKFSSSCLCVDDFNFIHFVWFWQILWLQIYTFVYVVYFYFYTYRDNLCALVDLIRVFLILKRLNKFTLDFCARWVRRERAILVLKQVLIISTANNWLTL